MLSSPCIEGVFKSHPWAASILMAGALLHEAARYTGVWPRPERAGLLVIAASNSTTCDHKHTTPCLNMHNRTAYAHKINHSIPVIVSIGRKL